MRTRVTVALASFFLAAGCTKPVPLQIDIAAVSDRVGGVRPLTELDVVKDQAINELDWMVFQDISETADSLDSQSREGRKMYTGPKADAPAVFSSVRLKPNVDAASLKASVGTPETVVDLSGVAADRLEELFIEARWLAGQARVAALAGAPLRPDPVGGLLVRELSAYNADAMPPKDVCDALAKVDTEPYRAAGITPAAVFDLDSTVWEGNVTDAFMAMMAEKNLPKAENNAALQAFLETVPGIDVEQVKRNTVSQNIALLHEHATRTDLPKEQRVSPKDAFYSTVTLLKGLTTAEVQQATEEVFNKGNSVYPPWKQRIFAGEGCSMLQVIRTLEERGVQVYLLSATLDVLAEEAGRVLGVPKERVKGSVLEIKDGVYTGEVLDSTYYTKGPIVRQWLPAPPLFAFGDSPTSDFPMLLEAVSAAFMINPRDDLQARDDKEAGSRMVAIRFPHTLQNSNEGQLLTEQNAGVP